MVHAQKIARKHRLQIDDTGGYLFASCTFGDQVCVSSRQSGRLTRAFRVQQPDGRLKLYHVWPVLR